MKTKSCSECEKLEYGGGNSYRQGMWMAHWERRELGLVDDIDEDIIENLVMQIHNFNKEDNQLEKTDVGYNREDHPIRLFINTNGGNASESLTLASSILASKTPVIGINLGKAHSGGFIALVCCHLRLATQYSTAMWHPMKHKNLNFNSSVQLAKILESLNKTQSMLDEVILNQTKITRKMLDNIYREDLDYFFYFDDAKKYKIIDGLYRPGF